MLRLVLCGNSCQAVSCCALPCLFPFLPQAVQDTIHTETGGQGEVTCRFTHVYPDGPAPYYTVLVRGANQGAKEPVVEAQCRIRTWQRIKRRAMDAILAHGGTASHHHAVGRLHRRPWAEQEKGAEGKLFLRCLSDSKRVLDPAGVMNPGVLLPVHAKL